MRPLLLGLALSGFGKGDFCSSMVVLTLDQDIASGLHPYTTSTENFHACICLIVLQKALLLEQEMSWIDFHSFLFFFLQKLVFQVDCSKKNFESELQIVDFLQ